MINEALKRDYTKELVEQEKAIENEMLAINQRLAEFSLSYISPQKMATVLQKLLSKHKELNLSQFKINPVKPIYAKVPATQDKPEEVKAEKQEVAFYQHTLCHLN